MEYRKMRKLNISPSLLGFGAMRLKTKTNGDIDYELGNALIDKAYQNGVNYFDTAATYTDGRNEKFLGQSLKRYPRESYFLATKLSLFRIKEKEEIYSFFERQLEQLGVDYVDFYLLHSMDKNLFKKVKEWGVIDILRRWQKEGKIRYIGFSFHDDYKTFKEILDYYHWDFCQIQLNYMDTSFQQGLQGYYDALEKEIPVIIMEPLKGGKLANFNTKVSKLLTDYDPNASTASFGFRYLFGLEGVKVILSGMNDMAQLEDNLKTFKNPKPLNKEEQELIKQVETKLNEIFEVDCTKCRYCMPCPAGVDIPENFEIFNDYAMYQAIPNTKWNINLLKKRDALYDACIECGACLSLCPQKIDIPNELKRMKEALKFIDD
ncbi:MAG TPA: aldo/keto reductase [Acholeplasma sp.]|nr:aldo/keto reductase [Acholeplasma sp.]